MHAILSLVVTISVINTCWLPLAVESYCEEYLTFFGLPYWAEDAYRACFSGKHFAVDEGWTFTCQKFIATIDGEKVTYHGGALTRLSSIDIHFHPTSPATTHPEFITIMTQLRDEDAVYTGCYDEHSKFADIAASQWDPEINNIAFPFTNFIRVKAPHVKDIECYLDMTDQYHASNITLIRQCRI